VEIAVIEEFFDVAVIGSGFGGAVTACRAAEAGRRVLVLERGRLYRPGEFPRDSLEPAADFWDPSEGAFGPFQVWSFRQLDVIVPSGVGGGWLICATAMARMPETWFAAHARDWPLRYSDLDENYRAVEKMMIAEPASLALAVAGGGRQGDLGGGFGGTSFGGDFGGGFRGEFGGGFRGTDGAEDTPDVSYLAQAQRRGAEIRPLHEVKRITAITGGYELDYVVHRSTPPPWGRVRHPSGQPPALRRLRARTVVLAAGALGSTWLLLTNRPGLPYLSGQLGTRFFGAGDAPGVLTLTGGRLDLNWSTDGSRRYLRDVWKADVWKADVWKALVTRGMVHRTITPHSLGGCPMGKNPAYGVVDRHGEAFGHPGLFIADGSVLPTPVGANPSLTIAALAERFADKVVQRSR
jgi:cholesterol oxidase